MNEAGYPHPGTRLQLLTPIPGRESPTRKVTAMEGDQQDIPASTSPRALTEVATLLAQEQRARRIREDRFRAVAEASSDLLWITTPDGFMHEESPTWRAFTGQGALDALGQTWLDALHPDDREPLEETLIQTLATGW